MKNIIRSAFFVFLVTALIIALPINAFAADVFKTETGKTVVTMGDWVYEKINNDTQWELDEYIGDGGKVIVPRIVGDLLVVSFGNHCFMNNTTVTEVVTSSPLWTIGEYAFIDCTSLQSIDLNYALHTIGTGAFSGTTSLKSINLENCKIKIVNPYTFLNSGIEKVELPDTCTEIGNYGFGQCAELEKIVIPDSVTTIADTAFTDCDNLVIYCNSTSYAAEYAAAKGIPFVEIDKLKKGDANGDGKVDVLDVTYIQKYRVGLSGYTLDDKAFSRADVNNDGNVTVRDATLIQMKLAGYTVDF